MMWTYPVLIRIPDFLFELVSDSDVVERLAGVGIDLEKLGADEGTLEVVRNQPSDDTRLDDVLTNLLEALGRGFEIGRHDVAACDPVFDDLGKSDVGREKRAHPGAVHAGNKEDVVGRRLQGLEKPGSEDVPLSGHERDEDAIRSAELFPVSHEGLHVLVLQGQELAEAGVDLHARRPVGHEPCEESEDRDDPAPPAEHQAFEARDDGSCCPFHGFSTHVYSLGESAFTPSSPIAMTVPSST
jgi:hypothetical protein